MRHMNNNVKYDLKDAPSGKKRDETEKPAFKTEDMLKREARERIFEEDKLEAAKPPRSDFQKKVDNFFFHYKWHTIIVIIGALLTVFFIRDTLFKEKPDATMVIATSRYITQVETDALQTALVSRMDDYNGDGKVLLSFDTIYLPIAGLMGDNTPAGDTEADPVNMLGMSSMDNAEMIQASSMKLMAVVAAWTDPLFLLDDDMYEYLSQMAGPTDSYADGESPPAQENAATLSEYAIFEALSGISPSYGPNNDRLAIKDTVISGEPGLEFISELSFSVRPAQNSNEKNVGYQAYCVELLEKLASR